MKLNLKGLKLTDAQVIRFTNVFIRYLRLEEIDLSFNELTENGIKYILNMKLIELKLINIEHNKISVSAYDELLLYDQPRIIQI